MNINSSFRILSWLNKLNSIIKNAFYILHWVVFQMILFVLKSSFMIILTVIARTVDNMCDAIVEQFLLILSKEVRAKIDKSFNYFWTNLFELVVSCFSYRSVCLSQIFNWFLFSIWILTLILLFFKDLSIIDFLNSLKIKNVHLEFWTCLKVINIIRSIWLVFAINVSLR